MESLRLEMTFKNVEGRTNKISVDNAREDLTDTEIKEAMDGILDSNIFTTAGGDLVEKSKAELITTEVKEFEIE